MVSEVGMARGGGDRDARAWEGWGRRMGCHACACAAPRRDVPQCRVSFSAVRLGFWRARRVRGEARVARAEERMGAGNAGVADRLVHAPEFIARGVARCEARKPRPSRAS